MRLYGLSLIALLFSVVVTQDCGNALECYTKSLELLKEARAMHQRSIEKIDKAIADFTGQTSQKIDNLSTQVTTRTNSFRLFYIESVSNGTCLTATANDQKITLTECNIKKSWNSTQAFRIFNSPEGWYTVQSSLGLFLEKKDDGRIYGSYDLNIRPENKKMMVSPWGREPFKIFVGGNFCMDVYQKTNELIAAESHGGTNQQFYIRAIDY